MMPWNYKIITVLWWWILNKAGSLQEKNCLITFKVNSIAHSRNGAPRGGIRTQHKGARKENGTSISSGAGAGGEGVDGVPLCWPDYSLNRMSSHNKGFIITSWRVAAVWELCAAVFSARRPKNVAQLCFGRKVQRTTNPVFVCHSCL